MAAKKQTKLKEQPAEKIKQVLLRIPDSLFKEIKVVAIRRDKSFNAAAIAALKYLLKNPEDVLKE